MPFELRAVPSKEQPWKLTKGAAREYDQGPEGGEVRGGGGELSPVNWFWATRELGPEDRIP